MKKDTVIHAGVKGMKWGVRRYQNYDGSLTPEGRIRYGSNPTSSGSKSKSSKQNIRKIDLSKYSDEELIKKYDRMTLEKKVIDAYNSLHPKKKSRVKRIVSDLAEHLVVKVSKGAIDKFVNDTFYNQKSNKGNGQNNDGKNNNENNNKNKDNQNVNGQNREDKKKKKGGSTRYPTFMT